MFGEMLGSETENLALVELVVLVEFLGRVEEAV